MPICGVDYVTRLNQIEKPKPSRTLASVFKVFVGGCLLLILGLGLGKLIVKKHSDNQLATAAKQTDSLTINQPQQESMLAVINQDDSPVIQRVAGVSTKQNPTSEESHFGLITAAATPEACPKQNIFFLGEKETDQSLNPADEFNWVGALEVLPEYPDPFVIDTNTTQEFPWRTTLPNPSPITINFTAPKETSLATLTLGWAVGNQGTKSIMVLLDGHTVGTTTKHQAQMTNDVWQYMEQVADNIVFELSPGQHSLTLQPMIQSGDAIIWDYIRLETTACNTN